ncbi:LytTR family transcriptional regulator [Maribacter sp.]|nr:LytTR family transcriptional regulator [Maribacter sp.]
MFFRLPFNPSQKLHLLIALSVALWIYFFLVFVGPSDPSPLSYGWRTRIMVGYSIVFMLCYGATTFFQKLLFKKVKVWNVWLELVTLSVLFVLFLPSSFWYYKSQLILGEYSFYSYAPGRYLPRLPLILPLLFLSRWIAAKWLHKKEHVSNKHYVISGENKLDVLQVHISDLICVIAANNYIEVWYLNGKELQKKLMRSTLAKIHKQIPGLVKTHRSYLINSAHFVKWEDANSIVLSYIKVPVSRNYKAEVKSTIATRP